MKPVILIHRNDALLREKILHLAPEAQIVTREDLKDDSSLLSQVEVAYEGFRRNDIPQMKALKWIQRAGAGVEGLMTPAIMESDITVTNVSGIHARAITEHMFGMLLGATRALNLAYEGQKEHKWEHLGSKVESLYGKTLGILGAGAIGRQAAKVGKAFDMKVIGLSRSGKTHPDFETMFTSEDKLEFFRQSNVVMNILPLTDSTQGFMSDAEFDALPDGAIVINTGRGGTIDTDALLRAIEGDRLKAALLDVTDPEPLPGDHPLWTTPRVFITPHYSGSHPEYNAEADEIFLDNLRLYLAEEPMHHVVDKAAGY
jgi:D-2-hydroxyacid dehydrogenase (NADP+)